jgi:hypothetical protein
MHVSPVGLLVFTLVLALSYSLRGALVIGVIASWAFGATAVVTITSLGGSSPLIYALFGAVLLTAVAVRPGILRELGVAFGTIRATWVVAALMLYAIAGAMLFPRLFAGQTTVFVAARAVGTAGGIEEVSLSPVSGNISQTAYLLLGALTMLAFCVLLQSRDRIAQVRMGFFLWVILHTGMGVIDLLGKLAGLGDVLAPIRTASYAMLTETIEGGFWRITGGGSEASAFGSGSLAGLSFCYVYWRRTGSPLARNLALVLLALTVLCTSTTAYVGLAILGIPAAGAIVVSLLAGSARREDMWIIGGLFVLLCLALATSLLVQGFFDPLISLFDRMVLNKASSASGQERAYWNAKSLRAFVDTLGFGVGFGSSRASSWPIAVISQLGLIGSILMATLLGILLRGMGRLERYVDPETAAVVASVRAATLACVVAGSLSAGSADPGMIFFVAVALVATCRAQATMNARAGPSPGPDMRRLPALGDRGGPPLSPVSG